MHERSRSENLPAVDDTDYSSSVPYDCTSENGGDVFDDGGAYLTNDESEGQEELVEATERPQSDTPSHLQKIERNEKAFTPATYEHSARPTRLLTQRQQDVMTLAVGAFDGLIDLRDRFQDEVAEGYPAAWDELTQVLANALPAAMHGHASDEGKTIQTSWEFEQPSAQNDYGPVYIRTTVALPDGAEGKAIASALKELATPSSRRLARPALPTIWGVKSYYDREQGRQQYPPEPLALHLLEYVSVNATHIRASRRPDMRHETVIGKEYDGAAYEVDRIARLLAEMTRLIASQDDDLDIGPVRNLMELCDDYIEADEDISPEAMIAYIDRHLLERRRQPKRTLDALLKQVQGLAGGIVLQDCDFKTLW